MEMDTEIPPKKISSTKTKVSEFIIDETLIKVGSDLIWLWVAIEPKHRQILRIDISFDRDMLISVHYIPSLINKYDRYPVSTEMVELGIHLKSVSF